MQRGGTIKTTEPKNLRNREKSCQQNREAEKCSQHNCAPLRRTCYSTKTSVGYYPTANPYGKKLVVSKQFAKACLGAMRLLRLAPAGWHRFCDLFTVPNGWFRKPPMQRSTLVLVVGGLLGLLGLALLFGAGSPGDALAEIGA